MEHQEDLDYAKARVNDLRKEIQNVMDALESFEGALEDVQQLDEVTLTWVECCPDANDMINSLGLESAQFHIEFKEEI